MSVSLLEDAELQLAVRGLAPEGDAGEALARIVWSVIVEPGDGDAGSLIEHWGARDALSLVTGSIGRASPPQWKGRRFDDALARWKPRATREAVLDAVRGAEQVRATLLIPGDDGWPVSVDDLGCHAPILLWVRGDRRALISPPRVAIVGARASSGYGETMAAEFAGDLAAAGAVVVSGGAYGIDGAAHRAALRVGGSTVAFLAGGVDRAYPQGHRELLRSIADTGAVVSEVPCGTAPTKWRFLARNRLIAAVSDAVVVVEAGWRSGSLNTAGHAAALGRPLGAMPGPVTSATSAGCHRLLREYDARCVTTTAEIRELWGDGAGPAEQTPRVDHERTRVLDALGSRSAVTTVEIGRRSGLSPERVGALLGLLEVDEEVRRDGTGWRRATARSR